MPTIKVVDRSGNVTEVEAECGISLMEVFRSSGLDEILALCGGCCACATCHIFLDEDDFKRLPPPSRDEEDLLDSIDARQATSRLSCQIEVSSSLGEITVVIAPEC